MKDTQQYNTSSKGPRLTKDTSEKLEFNSYLFKKKKTIYQQTA